MLTAIPLGYSAVKVRKTCLFPRQNITHQDTAKGEMNNLAAHDCLTILAYMHNYTKVIYTALLNINNSESSLFMFNKRMRMSAIAEIRY